MPGATEQYDVIVIGGGPAGYGAALYAASAGLHVAIVEKDRVGGTCLNRGCIPAKSFLETAAVLRNVARAGEFGVSSSPPTVDFAVAQARKQRIVDGLVKGLGGLIKARKVTLHVGVGSLGPDRTVTVGLDGGGEVTVQGAAVILAAGSVPRMIPGFDRSDAVMSSDEVLMLHHVPERVAVIGAGAVGCEFASAFADLGAHVTVLESQAGILPGCDADVASVVLRTFARKGAVVRTGVSVSGHTPRDAGGTTVHVAADDGSTEDFDVDVVMVTVGRRPYTDELGLQATKVGVDRRGFVEVDEHCRTSEPEVFAVGDVIDTPQLAHVGYAEAVLVVKQLLGESPTPIAYDRVPWAIYCHPEVAFVGPDEATAQALGHDVVVAKHNYRANSRAQIIGETEGLVKVIARRNPDGTAGQVLGVHMVGPWVTEQLSGGYLAVNWEADVAAVAEYLQPHPSLTELLGETMLSLTGRRLNS